MNVSVYSYTCILLMQTFACAVIFFAFLNVGIGYFKATFCGFLPKWVLHFILILRSRTPVVRQRVALSGRT